jgi:hypothetical protein
MAQVLGEAPLRVGLGAGCDGWIAACLVVAGRVPVWIGPGDARRTQHILHQAGLPGLAFGSVDAVLDGGLVWSQSAPARAAPLAPRPGLLVTVVVVAGGDDLDRRLASAFAQSWPCEVLLLSPPGAVVPSSTAARHVAVDTERADLLAQVLEHAQGDAIIWLEEGDELLPGAIAVLGHALYNNPERDGVWGDSLRCDLEGRVLGMDVGSRLPAAMAVHDVLGGGRPRWGTLLARKAAWLRLSAAGGHCRDLGLDLAARGSLHPLPLPVLGRRVQATVDVEPLPGQVPSPDEVEASWRRASPIADRGTAHLVAAALVRGGRHDAARTELERWRGPPDLFEARVRTRAGLSGLRPAPQGCLIVIDDGDEGALEETLWRRGRRDSLYVDMEVARDPIGAIRRLWPGHYAIRASIESWVTEGGPYRLALSSAPGWTPPPIHDLGLLPDLPAPEAVLGLAAVLGWEAPERARVGLPAIQGPVATLCVRARRALVEGRPAAALEALRMVMERQPLWRGVWLLTAETYLALGMPRDAEDCVARAGP